MGNHGETRPSKRTRAMNFALGTPRNAVRVER